LEVALLEHIGMTALRLDGTMSATEQEAAVLQFENDDNLKIIMETNRSGGLGRSFTPAGLVDHLTACWNPGLAAQCTDRVIRLPQKKVVYVYHLLARDLIEVRVFQVQQMKRSKAMNLLDPDPTMERECENVAKWKKHQFVELVICRYSHEESINKIDIRIVEYGTPDGQFETKRIVLCKTATQEVAQLSWGKFVVAHKHWSKEKEKLGNKMGKNQG
jgi:hypothetical protein